MICALPYWTEADHIECGIGDTVASVNHQAVTFRDANLGAEVRGKGLIGVVVFHQHEDKHVGRVEFGRPSPKSAGADVRR